MQRSAPNSSVVFIQVSRLIMPEKKKSLDLSVAMFTFYLDDCKAQCEITWSRFYLRAPKDELSKVMAVWCLVSCLESSLHESHTRATAFPLLFLILLLFLLSLLLFYFHHVEMPMLKCLPINFTGGTNRSRFIKGLCHQLARPVANTPVTNKT